MLIPDSSHLIMKQLCKNTILVLIILLLCLSWCQTDPLPSWNDDSLKASIIAFVKDVTTEGSPKFVPAQDRIATFDNDGTLWAEQPLIEGLFMFFRAKQMIVKDPSLKNTEPFKSIAAGDMAFLKTMTEQDLIKFFIATHSNLTADEFRKDADSFFAAAKSSSGAPVAQFIF